MPLWRNQGKGGVAHEDANDVGLGVVVRRDGIRARLREERPVRVDLHPARAAPPPPGAPPASPLGYTGTIDATPKDKDNRDTLGSGTVDFQFSDPSLVDVRSN